MEAEQHVRHDTGWGGDTPAHAQEGRGRGSASNERTLITKRQGHRPAPGWGLQVALPDCENEGKGRTTAACGCNKPQLSGLKRRLREQVGCQNALGSCSERNKWLPKSSSSSCTCAARSVCLALADLTYTKRAATVGLLVRGRPGQPHIMHFHQACRAVGRDRARGSRVPLSIKQEPEAISGAQRPSPPSVGWGCIRSACALAGPR